MVFNFDVAHNLYAIAYHRNHLGIMSANPITDMGTSFQYDFILGLEQVYGGFHGHRQLEAGKWGMVSGDADGNGEVDNKDKNNLWKTQLVNLGYYLGDFDMNSQVEMTDKGLKLKNNSGKCSFIVK